MATNHYRALLMEMCHINNPEGDLAQQARLLEHAIACAPAFAYLPWETYDRIREWCDRVSMSEVANWNQPKHKLRDEFWNIMMEHLPQMGQEWLDLGKPRCAEDWGRVKYPPEEGEDNG